MYAKNIKFKSFKTKKYISADILSPGGVTLATGRLARLLKKHATYGISPSIRKWDRTMVETM